MRHWLTQALAGAAFSFASTGALWADEAPVVVELFTSQGCSSCPPADEVLHTLAKRSDVIALALHVDYWDYIGWKDVFAHPDHAVRQRGYARRAGKRMVYTPQMVINGRAHVIGNRPMEVADQITAHKAEPASVDVEIVRNGGRLTITATAKSGVKSYVHLVRFDPKEEVRITRGENRGRTLSYANIVRDWRTVAEWDGVEPLSLTVKAGADMPLAVLVQEVDYGPILGAAVSR